MTENEPSSKEINWAYIEVLTGARQMFGHIRRSLMRGELTEPELATICAKFEEQVAHAEAVTWRIRKQRPPRVADFIVD